VKLLRYFLVASFMVTLVAVLIHVPLIFAQTPKVNATGCDTGSLKGLICAPQVKPVYKLVTGNWSLNVDGVEGILNILSVDDEGKINGTIVGGNVLCRVSSPCIINGSFDESSGAVTFISRPTSQSLIASTQNYTGVLSQRVLFDIIDYNMAGTGKEIGPLHGNAFGWYATMVCVVPC